jgi:hypothetical protein
MSMVVLKPGGNRSNARIVVATLTQNIGFKYPALIVKNPTGKVMPMPDILNHLKKLAAETKTSVSACDALTSHLAERYALSAYSAECRTKGLRGDSGQEDWLGLVLALNAAPNNHARAIIENKALIRFDELKKG